MKHSPLVVLAFVVAALAQSGCVAPQPETATTNIAAGADMAKVSGTALYRERIALPPDAIFEAMLEDVSRAGAPAEVLGRTRLSPAGQPPFSFVISYDASKLQPGHTYAIRARVMQGDQLLFTTDRHYPLPAADQSGNLQLLLVSTRRTTPAASLENTYWKLVSLRGKPVPAVTEKQREPHIVLSSEQKRVAGSGGCNRMAGSYSLSGQALKFSQLAGTLMACADGMEIEQDFRKALSEVAGWKINGNVLELSNAAGTPVAQFESRGSA